MFGFGFLLVPIYYVMCEAFGLTARQLQRLTKVATAVWMRTSLRAANSFPTKPEGMVSGHFGLRPIEADPAPRENARK